MELSNLLCKSSDRRTIVSSDHIEMKIEDLLDYSIHDKLGFSNLDNDDN